MKRLLPLASALCLSALTCATAFAHQPLPEKGADFMCFPGLDISGLRSTAVSDARNIARGPKLGDSKYDNTDGHDLREIPTEGDFHVLVILVGFADQKFSREPEEMKELVNDMLNGDNYTYNGATGSANQFYRTTSRGLFNPQFDVYGPVYVSKTEREYVQNNPEDTYTDADGNVITCYPAGRMVEEAIKGLDDQIDYSKYDTNNDGYVDFVYLFHAGRGATTGGSTTTTIWPHAFTLNAAIGAPVELDGVKINRYCTSSELSNDKKLSGIGTFCHEFGHVLGLPDVYDTKNNNGRPSDCFTAGAFDCMDAGNYNNREHTPPVFSSYEQYALEWMKPLDLPGTGRYTMLPFECHPLAYKVNTLADPQEYFLLETRGNSPYDKFIPGTGLFVWHIDFDLSIWQANTVNTIPEHLRIDLIEADCLESENTRNGDPFPGVSAVCEFTPNITPSFKDWNNKSTGYELREIVQNFDGTISFSVCSDGTSSVPEAPESIANPKPKALSADAESVVIEWPAVKNAKKYFISVFDAAAFNGELLPASAYAEKYYFLPLDPEKDFADAADGMLEYRIDGLKGNTSYGIMVYATDDINVSRSEKPVFVSTIDGADFKNAATNLYIEKNDENIIMSWDEIEGAESYDVNVVTIQKGAETDNFETGFTDNMLPDGWEGNGKFDTRSSGKESPSFRITQTDGYLQSPIYENQIAKLSFWCRRSYDENLSSLTILTADKNGRWTSLPAISEISGVKGGETKEIDLPAGVYGVRFKYNFASTGLDFYIDDICLTFCNDAVETPAEFTKSDISDTSVSLSGLKNGIEYTAYVVPRNAEGEGARSNEVAFRMEDLHDSGVENITDNAAPDFRIYGLTLIPGDSSSEYSVYTIDGITVAAGVKGSLTLPAEGLYIVRSNGSALKLHIY